MPWHNKKDKRQIKKNHADEISWLLALGEKEIQAGEGYDLEAVLAEAKAHLADKPDCRSGSHQTYTTVCRKLKA